MTLLASTAVLTAGCGAVGHLSASDGDPVAGKKAFMSGTSPSCASCHALVDAGSTSSIGPDLDAAFGPDRCQSFKTSTIRDVVRGQIAYSETDTGTGNPGMPANLATGQTAKDIAVYVASVAGKTWNCDTGAVG